MKSLYSEDEEDKKKEEEEVKEAVNMAEEALKKHREQLDEVPADRKGVEGYDDETEEETEDEIDKMKARKPHKGKEDMGQFV